MLPAYIPLIQRYSLELFEQCEDAEKLSRELVTEWLTKYMFANRNGAGDVAEEVAS